MSAAEQEERRRPLAEEIEKLGIKTLTEQRLEKRLETLKQLQNVLRQFSSVLTDGAGVTPEKRLLKLTELTHSINDMILQVSVPYGRAGSQKWVATMLRGWNVIYTRTLDVLDTTKDLLKDIDERKLIFTNKKTREVHLARSKEACMTKLEYFLKEVFVKNALTIFQLTWFAYDVLPTWSITLQNPFPFMGGASSTAPPAKIDRTGEDTLAEFMRQNALTMKELRDELRRLKKQ